MADTKDDPKDRGDDVVKDADDKELDEVKDAKKPETDGTDDKVDIEAEKRKAAEDPDEEKDGDDKKPSIKIPKARLDEAQRKAKKREEELSARITELETKLGDDKAKKTDPQAKIKEMRSKIDTLKEKYEDLLLDAKKSEAAKVRGEIDDLQDQLFDYRAAVRSEAARHQAVDDLKYDAALARAEADYPELNPENDGYDEERTDEVAVLMEAFTKQGFRKNVALEKAVKYVMGPLKKAADDASADTLKKQRDTDARKKAADADKKQPADLKKAGADADKAGTKEGGVDVLRLTMNQFDKLTDETKAKLRGDSL